MATSKNNTNNQKDTSSAVVKSAVAPTPLSTAQAETITNLVLGGDLSKMDAEARVRYYVQLCESLHLNPLTQPFQILRLSGKEVLYATKSCTEQLRKLQGVSVTKLEPRVESEVYLVVAYVQDAAGRTDVATGAVPTRGLSGENLANAFMKAETKAKRRATLSVCGLGILDESELDTLPQAQRVSLPAAAEIGTEATLLVDESKKGVAEASAPLSADPAPSTGASQNVAGPSVIPAGVLAKFTRQFEAVTSGIDLKKLWDSLTKNEATALFEAKEAAKARLAEARQQAAATVVREAPAAMQVAGSSTEIVDEFIDQPVFGPGPAVAYASNDQLGEIKRLLDNPLITRGEKTKLLLNIKKLDKERARQAIIKLRTAIGEREGIDPRDAVRAQVRAFVERNKATLSGGQAESLRYLVSQPGSTLDELVEALDAATAVLLDDETYGTDAELDEAENALAA